MSLVTLLEVRTIMRHSKLSLTVLALFCVSCSFTSNKPLIPSTHPTLEIPTGRFAIIERLSEEEYEQITQRERVRRGCVKRGVPLESYSPKYWWCRTDDLAELQIEKKNGIYYYNSGIDKINFTAAVGFEDDDIFETDTSFKIIEIGAKNKSEYQHYFALTSSDSIAIWKGECSFFEDGNGVPFPQGYPCKVSKLSALIEYTEMLDFEVFYKKKGNLPDPYLQPVVLLERIS
ncbi:MAG: hypothetical protein R3E21_01685 [Caenibius sp.]